MTDIELIMGAVTEQLGDVIASDEAYYSGYEIYLSNEQQFVRSKDRKPHAIYVVVKFLPATTNLGQRVVPITINAISEQNKIEVCQRLLNEFSVGNNLKVKAMEDEDGGTHYLTFSYTTPAVASNFQEIWDGYRSTFYMSGTILVSDDANIYSISYKGNEVATITSALDLSVSNDTQSTYASDNFTKSVPMYATLTIQFTTYFTQKGLTGDIIAIAGEREVDKTFSLAINFRDGTSLSRVFRLVNMSVSQRIGELPVASITMTE